MSDAYVGEIRIFAGTFAPLGWAFCNGTILSISAHPALYSLIGTLYGGDGKTTFAVPNLMGRALLDQGQGPGLSPYSLGEWGGSETVTLQQTQMAQHSHLPMAVASGSQASPQGNVWATHTRPPIYATPTSPVAMSPQALGPAGGGQPHNNLQPYLGLNFIISLDGEYPDRP